MDQPIALSTQLDEQRNDGKTENSDDEPMIYLTPRDYSSEARQQRARLLSEGADPHSIVLMSEVRDHVPPGPADESPEDYAKRYADTIRSLIQQDEHILNDQMIGNMKMQSFGLSDGQEFDLGPESGATKQEYREFTEWWSGI